MVDTTLSGAPAGDLAGIGHKSPLSLSPLERRKWEKKSTRPSFQLEIGGQEVLSVKVSCQCRVNQIALNLVISRPVSSCNPLLRRDIRGNLARRKDSRPTVCNAGGTLVEETSTEEMHQNQGGSIVHKRRQRVSKQKCILI